MRDLQRPQEAALQESATRMSESPTLVAPCYVSDPVAVTEMVGATLERFGRIDELSSSVGGCRSGAFADVTLGVPGGG
jgi:NAD(P)-dependent dehydrogenase (short-subunit alcohol dehydrogenase family)